MFWEKIRLLIADDEFWIRENLKNLIADLYDLEILPMASDGEEAIQIMEQTPADIIITDINMPYLSGVDLMKRISKQWPKALIVVLSGYSDFGYVHEALVSGAIDYLLKPVNLGQLNNILEKAIDRVLTESKEREEQKHYLEKMKQASSDRIDRNFSRWLHEAHKAELLSDSISQMYEYERNFSNYRLVLFKIIMAQPGTTDVNKIKMIIDENIMDGRKIIIHDLYHFSRFLLITDSLSDKLIPQLKMIHDQLNQNQNNSKIIISSRYFSFMTLRQAYDENCEALLKNDCDRRSMLCYAADIKDREIQQRLSENSRKEMEFALHCGDRRRFEQLLEMTGIFQCSERNYIIAELQNIINNIIMVVRYHVEKQGTLVQLMAVDNYMNTLLEVIDRLEFHKIRELFRQLLDECFSDADSKEGETGIQDIVKKAKSFIDDNYRDQISLSLLSSRFNIADSYLSHMFKEVIGQNMMLYLASVRIQHAKELLLNQDISITEIAIMVGYDDYSYFSRVFRKLEGTSPRAYREKMIK